MKSSFFLPNRVNLVFLTTICFFCFEDFMLSGCAAIWYHHCFITPLFSPHPADETLLYTIKKAENNSRLRPAHRSQMLHPS